MPDAPKIPIQFNAQFVRTKKAGSGFNCIY